MLVLCQMRLTQQLPHESHTLAPTYEVRIRFKRLVRKNGPVTAEYYPAFWRVLTDQSGHLLHFMIRDHNKRDADIVIALFQFFDEFFFRRIMKSYSRIFQILGYVIKGKLFMNRSGAEHPLRAGYLGMQKLITDTVR